MNNNNGKAILESMKQEGLAKRKRWEPVTNIINEAYAGQGLAKMDEWKEIGVSSVLETHSNQIAKMRHVNESTGTQPANTSFIMRHGINVLASTMSGLIAHDQLLSI